jgi:hypothetical protein
MPAPPPERGTRIVFVGRTRDELLTVDVEENAPAVSCRAGFRSSRGTTACLSG